MLQDAKLVDGRALERTEVAQREEIAEEEMPEVLGEEVVADPIGVAHNVDHEHRAILFAAVRAIFESSHLNIEQLPLSARELRALEHLKSAVEGRDEQLGGFVYAEDRRDMLEQALAVLQPNLVHGDAAQIAEMRWVFDEMSAHVSELRERLELLAEAQEELLEFERAHDKAEGGDSDDAADADKHGGKAAKKKPATTEENASLFDGPEVAPAKRVPTTLVGPDVPVEKKPPTTLVGADVPAQKKPPTTLTGADLPAEKKPPSMLGDDDPEPPRARGGKLG